MRHHIRIRRFLNKPGFHAGAYVIAEVGDSACCRDAECADRGHRWCVDPVLKIADCDRVVSLDFDVETAADRRNSLYKINLLIDALVTFRTALELEAERAGS